MSARDAILARVRAALGDVPASEVPADVRVDRAAPARRPGDVDLFVERVADYRAVVERCAGDDLPARVAAALAGVGHLLVPPDLPRDLLAGLGPDGPEVVADHDLAVAEIDRTDAVLTVAAVGIAETGTVVLDHGPGQGRRALSLVPDHHVCVVRADQVVADVPAAVAGLDPRRPQTWISGPSATSDIELSRVEGVHGPRRLHVIVADGA